MTSPQRLGRADAALVVGSNGIVGRNMVEYLRSQGGCRVLALARSHRSADTGIENIAVDLSDEEASAAALRSVDGVTHVFFAALAPGADPADQVEPNLALLRHAVTPLLAAGSLRHVCLVQGTKWYGSHLGPYRTPAKEDDPRHAGPNFYFAQHDWLSAAQAGQHWSFSTLRPHFICGFNTGNPHNMVAAIGAYAAIRRELGEPLDFPGTQACFDTLTMATEVNLLNRAMLWAATMPACANQDFNITNGDVFRWRNLWPAIAASFDMPAGEVRPLRLAEYMAGKDALWRKITARHGLRPTALADVVSWSWADFLFRGDWDDISAMTKARQFGFTDCIDTENEILAALARYRAERMLP